MNFDPRNLEVVRYLTLDNILNTQIAASEIHGFGLFAGKYIKRNTLICLLEGQILDRDVYKKIGDFCKPELDSLDDYFFMECNYISQEDILVRPLRTKYSYINHSKSPNVKIFSEPFRIEAISDIEEGQELTIDYTNEHLSNEYLSRPEKAFLKE